MMKLIILPFKVIAAVLIPVLLVIHFTGAIVLGLSSIITNLLASLFLLGSIAGWIMHESTAMLAQTVGIGIFFALVPHMTEWLLGRLTDLTIILLDFVCS